MIRRLKILLMIDNCSKLISKDFENFKDILYYICELTEYVKIVLITHEENNFDFQDHKISSITKQVQIQPLTKIEAVKMMYQLNQSNETFLIKYPTLNSLNSHKLFDQTTFTPLQISHICDLLQTGMTLDQYSQHLQQD